jgi:CIC family chloride channel protein
MRAVMRFTPEARGAVRRARDVAMRQVERSPRAAPMALAAVVGLGAGLSSVLFSELLEASEWFFFDVVHDELLSFLPGARLLLIPLLGGLLVGPITVIAFRSARGDAIPEVMVALDQRMGRLPPLGAAAKIVAASLTIGSGGSVGRQGPIVFLGAAIGSVVAQALRLTEQNVQLLVAAGAAGGIAATFNAPIAGVFFALEVLLRRFTTRNFSVVVLSSVVATVVAIQIRGDQQAIPVEPHHLASAFEIPLYALLGVLCGAAAALLIRTLYWSEDRFVRLPFPPLVLVPALGGLIVGALGLIDRGVLGIDAEALDQALTGQTALGALVLLLGLKIVATSVTVGSGGSGGVFFPSLFLGAMAGSAYGTVAHDLLPDLTAGPGAYATVGMAALFAGAARAPLTSVLILVEMTNDFDLMVPLLTAVATATVAAQLLSEGSIYSIKAQRLGVVVEEDEREPVGVLMQLRVADAMTPVMLTFRGDASVQEIAMAFEADPDPVALVVSEDGELEGLVTGHDVNEALAEGQEHATAREIGSTELRTIHADESLHDALGIFARRGIRMLPVVGRGDEERRPQGLLRRSDITQAYAEGIERRVARERRQRLAPIRGSDDVRYLDLRVGRESGLGGKLLSELELTEDAVIVAVRRDGMTLIPRGHTRLDSGDRVTVIAAASAVAEVRAQFEGRNAS